MLCTMQYVTSFTPPMYIHKGIFLIFLFRSNKNTQGGIVTFLKLHLVEHRPQNDLFFDYQAGDESG